MRAEEQCIYLPKTACVHLRSFELADVEALAEIFTRYARRLQSTTRRAPHPDNVKFTGSVPADVDAREAYRKHIVDKHR